eukprot:11225565-Lingulodinium_polyedra.AAC.1
MVGKELRRVFGVSPAMLPCWACLAHAVPDGVRSAFLQEETMTLWRVAQAYHQKHGIFPSMKVLALEAVG